MGKGKTCSYSLTTLVCIFLALLGSVPHKLVETFLSLCNPATAAICMPEAALTMVVEPALLNAVENRLKVVGRIWRNGGFNEQRAIGRDIDITTTHSRICNVGAFGGDYQLFVLPCIVRYLIGLDLVDALESGPCVYGRYLLVVWLLL